MEIRDGGAPTRRRTYSSVHEAKDAHAETHYDREVQNSVIAQLLLGVTVEEAANEGPFCCTA